MSGTSEPDRNGSLGADGAGVLANLPRTRPQRASARRAAARGSAPAAAAKATAAKADAAKPARAKKTTASARPKTAAKATAKPKASSHAASRGARRPDATTKRTAPAVARERVPRQGYAGEGDRVSGPVPPPGGAEFLATAAEIVNELAKAGLSTGERLVRDVFSRLPLT